MDLPTLGLNDYDFTTKMKIRIFERTKNSWNRNGSTQFSTTLISRENVDIFEEKFVKLQRFDSNLLGWW